MQSARESFSAPQGSMTFGPAEPPEWPRTLARIFGTIGFLLISPIMLMMAIGMISAALGVDGTENMPAQFYLFLTLFVVSGLVLALGLVVAWWNEGLGGLLILISSTALVGTTLGLALVVIFPAFAVGSLYLLSWALHRVDDSENNTVDQFSRWVRHRYNRRGTVRF